MTTPPNPNDPSASQPERNDELRMLRALLDQQQHTERHQAEAEELQRLRTQRQRMEAQERQLAAERRHLAEESRRRRAQTAARPLRPRRAQHRVFDAVRQGYEFGGLLLAEFAAFLIWFVFWLANGFFTALFVQAVALQLVGGLNRFIASAITPDFQLTLSVTAAWGIGGLMHLIVTLIELHLWRSGRRSTYPLILAVGVFDVYTSTRGIQALAAAWSLPTTGWVWLLLYVILAEGIALFPERRMIDHGTAIWLMLRPAQPATSTG
jgi:hypothetical protein